MTWLPIPSTVPTSVSGAARACLRQRLAGNRDQVLIGHFGTFGVHLTPLLEQILPTLLRADSRRTALLLGGGSARFAQNLTRLYPDLEGRCIAPGALPGEELAAHLAACDMLAQPYADGVSSRRTSLMAGLALGLPIVTTEGHLSEPLWRESRAVALAPVKPATAFIEQCEAVLRDPNRQAELRRRASQLYEERFAVANTVRALRS
jgi:glycosyltransferase involved in cell wall biosynthesis